MEVISSIRIFDPDTTLCIYPGLGLAQEGTGLYPLAATFPAFNVNKNIKLVPPFVKKDEEMFFPHFEKVALNLCLPEDVWPLLVQSVLPGHVRKVLFLFHMSKVQIMKILNS